MRNLIRNLLRGLDTRTLAALALLVISLAASAGTYIAYTRAQTTLNRANDALLRARVLRKLTDYKLCLAINENRMINNRDRDTFKRSRRETKAALKVVKDPVLLALLKQSLKQVARELAARPFLKPLACVKVIESPSGRAPPVITTPKPLPGG